ncbi:MAG: peptidoglycan-binding domain-containing protein [Pseudomonadota bacterium]
MKRQHMFAFSMARWRIFVSPRLAAVVLLTGALASGAAAQEGLCYNPSQRCAGLVEPSCLTRVGAGVLASAEETDTSRCNAQLETYQSCLTTVASMCGNPSAQPPNQAAACPQALTETLWAEAQEIGDCLAYETFLTACPGSYRESFAEAQRIRLECDKPRGAETPASSSAETEGTPSPTATETSAADPVTEPEIEDRRPAQKPAADVWRVIRRSRDARDFEKFLADYPKAPEVTEARAALRALRRDYSEGQRLLARLGYYRGAVDELWGRGSASALRAFQNDHGLAQANGVLTVSALAALREAPKPESPRPQPPAAEAAPTSEATGETARLSDAYRATLVIEEGFNYAECAFVLKAGPNGIRFGPRAIPCREIGGTIVLRIFADGSLERGVVEASPFRARSSTITLRGRDWQFEGRGPGNYRGRLTLVPADE